MPENQYRPPEQASNYLLENSSLSEVINSRRKLLLVFIWRERYLTRRGLVSRVEAILWHGCFGHLSHQKAFFRDMHMVKAAFREAGFYLRYSRALNRPGYYLSRQPALLLELATSIRSSVDDIDPIQIQIFRQMTVAERFKLGFSISDAARYAQKRK